MSNRRRTGPRYRSRSRTNQTLPLILAATGLLLLLAAALWLIDPFGDQPGSATPSISNAEVSRISLGDAKAAFDTGGAVFLDVRDQNAYTVSHIPGARSIPLTELENRLGELEKDAWIITYCT